MELPSHSKRRGVAVITIQKSKDSKSNRVQVTFTMPAVAGCDCLYLVGRFWPRNESTYRMQRADDGTWSLSLELEPDQEFQYHFRTNDGAWLDDDVSPVSTTAACLN